MSSEAASYNPLPRVEKTDIHLVEIEHLIDPEHRERWKRFAEENPLLAQELLIKAWEESGHDVEIAQKAINVATFATEALHKAFEREIQAFDSPSSAASVGDEDSPL